MNLNQVTAPSSDIERSLAFYLQLGLTIIVKSPHYARFVCPDGDATFSVIADDTIANGSGIHVYFECSDLDDRVTTLVSKGIHFDEMPNDKPWLWREAHLKDPDNNHIILYFAGANRLHPPWRIQS